MIVQQLTLENFRNYKTLKLGLSPSLNVLIGRNGSGKTNFVEAIHYLSNARSWRTTDQSILIREGCAETLIEGKIEVGELSKEVSISLSKGSKKISINGKAAKNVSELSKLVNVLLFTPSDVPLFMTSPSKRRSFLDEALCKSSITYQDELRSYNKLLTERNNVLKDENVDLGVLEVLTSQIASVALKIAKERDSYIKATNEILPNILKELLGDVNGKIVYKPFVNTSSSLEEVKALYEKSKDKDLVLKSTSIGPHREDFAFILNEKDLGDYASQGQNRMAVLSLKLSPYFLAKSEEKPIVVLDDVSSELDEDNLNRLKKFVTKLDQVFITATKLEIEAASNIEVATNNAVRRNTLFVACDRSSA